MLSQKYALWRIFANYFRNSFINFFGLFFILLIMSEFDIKKIRKGLGMTQIKFANTIGVTLRTVQNWEAGGKISECKFNLLQDLSSQAGEREKAIEGISKDSTSQVSKTTLDKAIDEISELRKALTESIKANQSNTDRFLRIIENREDMRK